MDEPNRPIQLVRQRKVSTTRECTARNWNGKLVPLGIFCTNMERLQEHLTHMGQTVQSLRSDVLLNPKITP